MTKDGRTMSARTNHSRVRLQDVELMVDLRPCRCTCLETERKHYKHSVMRYSKQVKQCRTGIPRDRSFRSKPVRWKLDARNRAPVTSNVVFLAYARWVDYHTSKANATTAPLYPLELYSVTDGTLISVRSVGRVGAEQGGNRSWNISNT